MVLLDGRRRARAGELFGVGYDHHWRDRAEGVTSAFAPRGEPAGGREECEAGVRVPDVRGEVLPEATLGAH